jgi:hypothetical protein
MKASNALKAAFALAVLVPLSNGPVMAAKKPKVEQNCPGQQYCYANCRQLNPSLQQCDAYCKSTGQYRAFCYIGAATNQCPAFHC